MDRSVPELIGVNYPGMRRTPNTQAVRNQKYFAYSTFLSVYVYTVEDMKLINVISLGKTIVTISLAQDRSDILAISLVDAVVVVDLPNNREICSFTTPETTVSIGWGKHDKTVVCFSDYFETFYIFDADTGEKLRTRHGSFENIRVMDYSNRESQIWIGGNNDGTVTRVDENLKGLSKAFPTRGRVVASALDPNCPSHCLIVWAKGSWALFNAQSLDVMNEVSEQSFTFSAAAWSSMVPGQFFTGDATAGVVRLWNASADTPIESLHLHTSGVRVLLDLPKNKLLIGYNDGMICVYDLECKRYVFQNKPGHSNTIFRIQFMPNSDDIFLTTGGEGALCSWSASTMKQIDRMLPPESLGVLLSMDISPGGGVVACGYGSGTVGLFSLQTRSLVTSIPLIKDRILTLSFSKFRSENLLCVSNSGFGCILNVETKEIQWQASADVGCITGTFSPHLVDTWAITAVNGRLMVWKENILYCSLKADDIELFSPCWSPKNPNVLVTGSDNGDVRIWNIEEKTSVILTNHRGRSRGICFHPVFDNILVTGGADSRIHIIDIHRKTCLAKFVALSGCVYALSFAPHNPHLLISAGNDSAIKFWTLDRMFTNLTVTHVLRNELNWIRPLEGKQQLLKLARRAAKNPQDKIQFTQSDIPHVNDIVRLSAKVVQKSMSNSLHETRLIKRAIKSKERMIQAAKLELYMGNIKHYCELMFATGEFDMAVAASPAVSHGFWAEMVKNRAKLYETEDQIANANLITGMVDKAVDILLESEHTDKAFLIAAAERNGAFKYDVRNVDRSMTPFTHGYIETEFEKPQFYLEYHTASSRAKSYLENGQIYLAASVYLSIGDVISAERLLIKHGQILTAFAVDHITGVHDSVTREKFALAAIRADLAREAFEVLDEDEKERVVIAVSFPEETERPAYYESIGLKTPMEYRNESESATGLRQMHLLLLAGDTEAALSKCVEYSKDNIHKAFADVREVVKFFENASLSHMNLVNQKLIAEFLTIAIYIAGYEAIWKGYTKIYKHLRTRIQNLARIASEPWASDLAKELCLAIDTANPNFRASIRTPGDNFLNPQPLGQMYDPVTKYGTTYTFDDGLTSVPMEEALMWHDVTQTSLVSLTGCNVLM